MSWRDRPYYRDQSLGNYGGGGVSFGFPKPTRYVIWLLAANGVVFLFEALSDRNFWFLLKNFSLLGNMAWASFLEPWRLISYQFIHNDPWHLLMNMFGLYFFGPPLEKYWGPRRFLIFYLLCGVAGGLAFIVLSTALGMTGPLIGASGAVLGLLAACAVLFPQMVLIFIFFPVPIRVAAMIIIAVAVLYILWEKRLGEACHLGGMIAGFLYVRARPLWSQITHERKQRQRQALLDQEAEDQRVVDQILDKVHQNGIQSLTWAERRTLRNITQRQKQRDDLRKKGR